MNTVRMVIGSWGSYNECNERALGSKWLDFNNYEDWDEIVEELKKEGFELEGLDEELFVQDIEGIPTSSKNWDHVYPQTIFELIKKSGILDDEYKYELMEAYCEACSFDEWEDLVERLEEVWDMDIYFYPNKTMVDVAHEIICECYDLEKILSDLSSYFDYEAYARDMRYNGYTETSNGVIEIR